jgi:hypothetical protein
MSEAFTFTLDNLERQYKDALEAGYEFLTCLQYFERRKNLPAYTIVNRVDIDLSIKKADRLRAMFDRLGIKATFFVRLHAEEYNPFSFENYWVLKKIRDSGHEIGYHSEIVDEAAIWSELAEDCLRRDVKVLNEMLGIKLRGVASHGGMTGLNNLDFWKNRAPSEFNLAYEAYDDSEQFNLFKNSLYISDSEWTRWKCYENGKIREGDRREFAEHLLDKPPLVYLLVHPDTYYTRHIYE